MNNTTSFTKMHNEVIKLRERAEKAEKELAELQGTLAKLREQELLHVTVESWQPITTLTHHTLMAKVVDVWSKKHGRVADVSYGQETYGEGVGVLYQTDYDCNGPVYGLVKDATHWMIVKGPTE